MIILHLGMPKTGTTVLQHSLALNASEKGGGLTYPVQGRNGAKAHHQLAATLRQGGVDAALNDGLLDSLRRSELPVVLSSEALGNLSFELLEAFITRLQEVDQVVAVLAVRELSSFLESMYLQSTRFGTQDVSFDSYVQSRTARWIDNLFQKIRALKDRLGENFKAPLVVEGFDSITEITGIAGVPADVLSRYRDRLPRTMKHSLKTQTAMLHLPEIEQRISRKIDRRKFLSRVKSGLVFDEDIREYTILFDQQYEEITRTALESAETTGFSEYVLAFGNRQRKQLPKHALSIENLTAVDLDVIARSSEFDLRP